MVPPIPERWQSPGIVLWTGTMFQVYIGEIPVRKYMSNARILYTPTEAGV